MARVNHKKVKQMLEETRKKISDRQFFTSRILAGHYEDMAAAQTRRYKYNRRIKMKIIWKPRDQSIALTNNLNILINAGHPIVTKRNRLRQDRYMIVTGLFTHELGHALLHTEPINHFDVTTKNVHTNVEYEANLFAVALLCNEDEFNMPLAKMSNAVLKSILDCNVSYGQGEK